MTLAALADSVLPLQVAVRAGVGVVLALGAVVAGWYTFPAVRQYRALARDPVPVGSLVEGETHHVEATVDGSDHPVPFVDRTAPLVVGWALQPTTRGDTGLTVASNARLRGDELRLRDDTGTVRLRLPDELSRFSHQAGSGEHLVVGDARGHETRVTAPADRSFDGAARAVYDDATLSAAGERRFLVRWVAGGDRVRVTGSPSRDPETGALVFAPGNYTLYAGDPTLYHRLLLFGGACVAFVLAVVVGLGPLV